MPKFFISHPVFAWVVAILISMVGVISIFRLGIESYPAIAPPQINVTAFYPGASAATVERTVTQVIEQQLTGIDNLVYFSSTSNASGRVTIILTFENGTDPDTAQVQVQNKLALASPRLPAEVTAQGVVVAKANAGFLLTVGVVSENPRYDRDYLNDLVASRVIEQVSRLPGVGTTLQWGAEYAMNVWLDPALLQRYRLSSTEVLDAIRGQNVQFVAGSFGADPAPRGQELTVSVAGEPRFNSPEQFEQILIRTLPDGSSLRLRDVARIALGPQNYGFDTQWNGRPMAAFGVQLQPGANALDTAEQIQARMAEISETFPEGVSWFMPYESTTFVKISIEEVVKTLIEAIVLVFIVMLVFLQNFRATLIPTLVIPVALLGTFAGLLISGFTINQLTMFAMVLAIGIVVDDAIVVIENVERIMAEEHLSPREATIKAMDQITGPVVAITVVLAAVFLPSAFQSGASGEIYKQFALTIAISMAFSAFLALGFTPALCASFLKTHAPGTKNGQGVFARFERLYAWTERGYVGFLSSQIKHCPRWMMLFVVLVVMTCFLFIRIPTSFIPEEDQGYALSIVQLPPGSPKEKTRDVFRQMRESLEGLPAFLGLFEITGNSPVGQSENVGMGFIKLKPWEDREDGIQAFISQANEAVSHIPGASIFVVNVPTVQGLGQFGGFDMWLEDRTGMGQDSLREARNRLLEAAAQSDTVQQVRVNTLEDAPQVSVEVDRIQAKSMGVSVADVYTAMQLMLAPVYANDFVYEGRVKRVNVRADADARAGPEALQNYFIPAAEGTSAAAMVPLSSVVRTQWSASPPSLTRFNGYSAANINGSPTPGSSSGEAMSLMTSLVDDLPEGFGSSWTGMSYQEVLAGDTQVLLLVLSMVVVFLCLAALYESWSIPTAVLMVVPLGVLGSLGFTMARGLSNDIFFQIGLITIIGLAAKNAILIVEFAVMELNKGATLREATLSASRLRLRPILMTSFAFIMGVVPMAISTGAGSNARHAIGTGVIGGMLAATVLGVLFIPIFFVVVRRLLGDRMDERSSLALPSRDSSDQRVH